MITVYHLSTSRSERIIWLMEEFQEPYELVCFQRENGAAPAAMRDIHPLGKAPIIRDGNLVLAESGAIVEYLCDKYNKLAPPRGTSSHADYLYWVHFAEGSAMSQFILEMITAGKFGGEPMRGAERFAQRTRHYLRFIEQEIGKRTYFAGDEFSGADIMMMYSLAWLERLDEKDKYPNIADYRARIAQRCAYQKGMAIANPPSAA